MNTFEFAKKSSRDYGLYITGQPFISGERDIEELPVPGRNGSLTVSNGRMENLEVTYECFVRNKLPERMRVIKAWLLGAEPYQKLADSYQPDYFRLAYCKGPVDFEKIQRFGQGTITFRAKPMMYSWIGQKTVSMHAGGTLFNPETFPGRPHIKVFGSGQGTLFINSQSVTFNALTDYIEIDSETGLAYRDTANMGGTVIMASMPVLQGGANAISWDGGIAGIEITPRWCTA